MTIRNDLLEQILTESKLTMTQAPDDGSTYAAQGENWVNTLTQAANSLYVWDTDTTATDPATAKMKGDNSDLSLITELYVSGANFNGQDIDSIIREVNKGDFITLKRYGSQANFIVIKVTGAAIDNTGWFTIPVTVEDSGGGFLSGDQIEFVYSATSTRANNIAIERLIEGTSTALSQEPAGLGISNAINVEFGAAQLTPVDPVQLDVNGRITFNKAGLYRVKVVFQFGRTGSSQTAELLFRFLVNGVQLGRTVGAKLNNANDLKYIDIDNWFNVPQGATLDTQIMRDLSGNDSGGLFQTAPTDEGAGTWNVVPCAVIRVERFVNA